MCINTKENKALKKLDEKYRTDLLKELHEDMGKPEEDISVSAFFAERDEVYTCGPEIKRGKNKFRIDCRISNDEEVIKKIIARIPNDRDKYDFYYLQLQDNEENEEKHSRGSNGCTGSLTYANVVYPKLKEGQSPYDHALLFKAIIKSLEKQSVAWIEL